ncbi:aspartyl protease [Algoriphagus ratkowskyi]|uniref:Aspartyl protease n=1 Tax=Algoriphagus ratkowskyi TaxID=57028 RepID=A0A2W7R833_9BACT|nr:aspartyl protease family protein [Algoriphagus ratkowskyi]PZX54540.1 aspartyl protease [Algoriphagus ratkowskyi]TXD76859.1 PDZ domain-containing protein [Algoriphagus ratkowskyi]
MYKGISLFLAFFFATQLLCLAQVPGFFMKEDKRKAVIPFNASNSLIIIPVSINGNTPINFLVDTGVRSNILFSKNLGDALELVYTRRIKLVGADGNDDLMASISPINHFDLGPVEGVFQSLLVLEDEFIELESVLGIPIYGILGYEFFKFNPIKVNYDDGKMIFYKTSALKWRPLLYRKMDMTIYENKPYITTTVRQKDGSLIYPKLLIDTGANHGLLLNRETSDDITMPPLFLESALGQSLGGVLYGFIGRVEYMKLANFRLDEVLTSYPDETPFSYVIKDSGRMGSVGAEVLGRSRLIFDYPRSRLFVRKAENFFAPFEFNMSGMVVKKIPDDDNRIYVSDIRAGSPAHRAGLESFDEILSINKVPIFIWELTEINKLLRSEAGKEIELEIRRYENDDLTKWKDHKFTFVLRKQI